MHVEVGLSRYIERQLPRTTERPSGCDKKSMYAEILFIGRTSQSKRSDLTNCLHNYVQISMSASSSNHYHRVKHSSERKFHRQSKAIQRRIFSAMQRLRSALYLKNHSSCDDTSYVQSYGCVSFECDYTQTIARILKTIV